MPSWISSCARVVGSACLGGVVTATLAGCLDLKPGAKSIFDVIRTTSPEEAARWSIDKYDADKRYRGTLMLANAVFANEPVYIQLFLDNLKDEDPGVRAAATRGLANHGSPDHVPLIVERLKDEDVAVRAEAARALQRLHNPVAVEALIKTLNPDTESDPGVRAEAAAALGQYRRSEVVENLIASLDDENLAINHTTRDSLRTLTGQDFGYDRITWAGWNKDAKSSTFDAGCVYQYPVFYRDKKWYEYLPFVPPPPNEVTSTPAGLQPTAQ